MANQAADKAYSLEQVLRAQRALRELAGLEPEMFPVQAIVGMISDEVEMLRRQGHSDDQIAQTIRASSGIKITADEIAANYAPPGQRHQSQD